MPKQRWSLLSPEAHIAWAQIPNKDKAIVLGQNDDSIPTHQRPPDQRVPSQLVNLSEMSAAEFLRAYIHDTSLVPSSDVTLTETGIETPDDTPDVPSDDNDEQTLLINAMRTGVRFTPGDIRRVLSSSKKKSDGKHRTTDVRTHTIYRAGVNNVDTSKRSLVNRGANGGVAGSDVRIIHHTSRKVDIVGIDNHTLNDVYIGTAGGVVDTDKGPVILVLNQYALLSKGRTI